MFFLFSKSFYSSLYFKWVCKIYKTTVQCVLSVVLKVSLDLLVSQKCTYTSRNMQHSSWVYKQQVWFDPRKPVSNDDCVITLGSEHIFKDLGISPFTQLSCAWPLFEWNHFLSWSLSFVFLQKFSQVSEKLNLSLEWESNNAPHLLHPPHNQCSATRPLSPAQLNIPSKSHHQSLHFGVKLNLTSCSKFDGAPIKSSWHTG